MPETEEEGRRKQRFPSGGDLCFSLSSDYFWQEQNEEKACPGKKAVWLPTPVISQRAGRVWGGGHRAHGSCRGRITPAGM